MAIPCPKRGAFFPHGALKRLVDKSTQEDLQFVVYLHIGGHFFL